MHDRFRPLAWAAYSVAFLLLVIPLVDSVLGVWPARLGDVSWRYGAAGLFSRAFMTPLLGLLVALLVAVVMEHRNVARVLAGVAFVGAALAIGAVASFSLDALQTRAQVRPEALSAFDTATVVALAKYVVSALVAVLLGVGGWKAARRMNATPRDGSGRRKSREERSILLEAGAPRQR